MDKITSYLGTTVFLDSDIDFIEKIFEPIGGYSYVGGIVGYSVGSSFKRVYIYNSLNHGTIRNNGTTSESLYLGGIAGYTYYTIIENCVSG